MYTLIFYTCHTLYIYHFNMMISSCFSALWVRIDLQHSLLVRKTVLLGGNDKTRGPWATSLTWKINKIHKSINTFDDIITLIKRRRKNHYYLYENLLVLYLKKLESPSPKDALCQVWLKLAQWFWRRGFYNFVNVFLLFLNCSPWKRVGPFIWTNLNPL